MWRILCLIFMIAFIVHAQEVTVKSSRQIEALSNMAFYYPAFGHNDQSIILTSDNFKGIWKYNLINNELIRLNNIDGAGYKPILNDDGSEIIFRKDEFRKGRRTSSLIKQNLQTRDMESLVENKRRLSMPANFGNGSIEYVVNGNVEKVTEDVQADVTITPQPIVSIEKGNLILYVNNSKKILNPLGEGNYIWPSLSPDGTKILFTKTGDGTYVCDLNGNVVSDIGCANYPSWSKNGKWIVYMQDYDDGYVVTSSDIYVSTADGSQLFSISSTDDIHEMYPAWSNDNQKIICSTTDGKIYLFELSFN